ncbi:ATP-binding protein [Hoeflea sp. WL0058]|uniref:ATP-binding protein n=1 Tax=Flavimaribacter sediminis TaxID=2865987 RepID=A0AAE2ZPR2_9HYPH|nr:ATP-binding protein [Flavimaribacter sediminis]MBW8638626.1 ATP-binding protein [Flavimaribacter sediminis]
MISVAVEEESQIGAARRFALNLGKSIGLSSEHLDRLAIVVTEAGTNLVRHARNGEILVGVEKSTGAGRVVVHAVDSGPGIPNVEVAMADGYTTSTEKRRGIGGGLGAMRRMADAFDIFSAPTGTIVLAKVGDLEAPPSYYDLAGLVVPMADFEEGGDIYASHVDEDATTVMLMDVLGHGPKAARDARSGFQAFEKAGSVSLEERERSVSEALRDGRGAAALTIEIPHGPGLLRCIGIGNIKGDIIHPDGGRNGIPSQPGIVGSANARVRVTEHEWRPGSTLILATDGLKTSSAAPDPGALLYRSAEIIAAGFYKLKRRGTDDAGVLVVRHP